MKRKQRLSFVLIEHSDECHYTGRKDNPWSGLVDGTYFGNSAGNQHAKRGCHHLWIKVKCNSTTCKGIKAVHSSVLINA